VNNSTSTPSAAWPTIWPKDSFPLWPTVAIIFGALGTALVIGIVGYMYLRSSGIIEPGMTTVPVFPAIVFQLVLEGSIVAIFLLALPVLSKMSYAQLGFSVPKPWQIGVALIGAVVMVIVVEGGASLLENLMHQKHEQSVVQLFRQIIGDKSLMWFFAFFAIVLAPAMEETIFRLFFFNIGLRAGGFWLGAIISGVLFGLAHADLVVLGPLALGGIVLCGVYYRTKNAFCSMITHGCFNALTVLALIYAPKLAQ
jgi:membrane protease YdiL (CAAX protease family)